MTDPKDELEKTEEIEAFKEVWYGKTWLIMLLMLLVPPMGIYLMLRYQKTWSDKFKSILSAVSVSLFLICSICSCLALTSYWNTSYQEGFVEEIKEMPVIPEQTEVQNVKPAENIENKEKPDSENNEKSKASKPNRKQTAKVRKSQKSFKPQRKASKKSKHTKNSEEKAEKTKIQDEELVEEVKTECEDNEAISDEHVEEKNTRVYVTNKGKCYHFKKCRKGNYHVITLKDAEEKGLRPCKRCCSKQVK